MTVLPFLKRSMPRFIAAAFLVTVLAAQAPSRGTPPGFADLADGLLDAVVNISTSQTVTGQRAIPLPELPEGSPFQEFFEEFFNRNQQNPQSRRVSSLGSGFVIDPSGIIVTNAHVIADADEIEVNFSDGTTLKATVKGRDAKTDVAVLVVEPNQPLVAVEFGDSDAIRVGDWVMAIGNPFGLGGSVSVGIVSARNRDIDSGPYDDFIQTDAAINKGNSGGPLFDMDGKVIGINTAIISPSGGSIGIGFSVPTATAQPVIRQLQEYGETRRGWFGVRIQTVTEEIADSLGLDSADGALIAGVNPDGPAAAAGIEPGDVVLEFNGKPVPEMRDLPRIVAETEIGRQVKVTIWRKGEAKTIDVTIARLEEAEKVADSESTEEGVELETSSAIGLTLAVISKELREKYELPDDAEGVVVTAVDDTSAAHEKGLREGDVIVEVAQEAIATPEAFVTAVDKLREADRKSILMLVRRKDGDLRYLAVRLEP